jgi:hypothetical protein
MEEVMSNWKHHFNTKTFQDFVTKFFKDSALTETFPVIQIFNRKIVVPLTEDKNAEIVLSTKGVVGDYVGYRVKIIHKDNGVVAQEWFGFEEYLMDGYEPSGTTKYPQIIEHCGTDWYMNGAHPRAIVTITHRIVDYINLYK